MVLFLGAMWKWVKRHILRVEGVIEQKNDELMEDGHVMDAAYRRAIDDHTSKMVRLSEAVAQLKADLKGVKREKDEVQKQLAGIKEAQEGAKIEGEDIVKALRKAGKTQDEIEANKDFIAAMDFYDEQEATIVQMEARLATLTQRAEVMESELGNRKVQWTEMQRRGEELKLERTSASADTTYARAMLALNSAFASVDSQGDTAKDLASARAARDRVTARAELAGEMTGQDATVKRAKYADNVRKRRSASKFADLVGLHEGAGAASVEPEVQTTDAAATESTGKGSSSGPAPLT